MIDPQPNHIPGPNSLPPQELRELRGWLLWRYEKRPGEAKPRKVPHYVGGGRRHGIGLTELQIEQHLADLDPSMGREDWIRVGMAVHHETDGGGFDLWDEWSSDGHQYPDTTALQSQWDSFDRSRPGAANVTMATVIMMAKEARAEREQAAKDISEGDASADGPEPIDPWRRLDPPALPVGILPDVIERFARIQAEQMGADAGGLAQAALTVCAAAIPDSIQLQVKRHDTSWKQSARFWTALVGLPSAKKSPILRAAICSQADSENVRYPPIVLKKSVRRKRGPIFGKALAGRALQAETLTQKWPNPARLRPD